MTESDEQLYRRQDRGWCDCHKQRISLSDGCPDCAAEPCCETCVNYWVKVIHAPKFAAGRYAGCVYNRPLVPCEKYEREVGSDDSE